MNFLPIFEKMVELFLIIIIGYIGNKCQVFGSKAKQYMSKLILNITLPATILSAEMNSDRIPSHSELASILVVAFSSYAVLYVLAVVTSHLLGGNANQRGVTKFGIMFSNVGFIGYPVTMAVFGADSLLYTVIFNMPFNLLCYSLGAYFIKNKDMPEDAVGGRSAKVTRALKLILTPTMISSLICLAMAYAGVRGPRILASTFDMVGGITTPGALLIIGCSLAEMPVKEMFNNVRSYIFTIIKVVVVPVIIYFVYRPFVGGDALLMGVTVIICSMPVATAGTMLCVEYGGDEKFMAQVTFLSTLASVITIPILAALV